jgi:hypothetical protein
MTVYPDIEVGDLVTADLLDSMLVKTYTKASTTARNTTTTYADDPELLNISLGVGTWDIELTLFFLLATTSTQKLKTNWAFTGTWNNPIRLVVGPGTAQTGVIGTVTDMNLGGYTCTGQDAIYDRDTGAGFIGVREVVRNAVVTVAGNLSLQWAQSASSANNTSVCAGTSFVTRQCA